MGGSTSKLDEKLAKYEDLTYLNFKQIKHCYNRFTNNGKEEHDDLEKTFKTYDELFEIVPELKNNPFNERICEVFSQTEERKLYFLEFLDICSVFNENASQEAKINRAFQIFDFDGNGFIDEEDIKKVVKMIVDEKSSNETSFAGKNIDKISDQVFEEFGVPKGLKRLTKFQLQEMLEKSPDFADNFTFALQ